MKKYDKYINGIKDFNNCNISNVKWKNLIEFLIDINFIIYVVLGLLMMYYYSLMCIYFHLWIWVFYICLHKIIESNNSDFNWNNKMKLKPYLTEFTIFPKPINFRQYIIIAHIFCLLVGCVIRFFSFRFFSFLSKLSLLCLCFFHSIRPSPSHFSIKPRTKRKSRTESRRKEKNNRINC